MNKYVLQIIIILSLLLMSKKVMAQCFNFLDITNTDVCVANYARMFEGVFSNTGVIDFGYQSIQSRHTIHSVQGECDPMTLNGLKTIPDGEIASVRLGNWDPGNEQEGLTYTYIVSEDTPILLLKYAVVLHDGGHDGTTNQQPHFLIRVSDMQNNPINQSCFNIDFKANRNAPGWHVIDPVTQVLPDRPGDHPVSWKDWTSMGINLREYAGKQVKIYLETGDCHPAPGKSGHFGYAYFTLGCISGKLEGLTCGSASADTIIAPSGYRYEWYKRGNPTVIVSRNQQFVPQQGDSSTYRCRMISAENDNCYFERTAPLLPLSVKADAEYQLFGNTLYLSDNSYIYTQKEKISELYEQCNVYWEIGDTILRERNVVYEFPADGVYEVKLYANFADGCSSDTLTKIITVANNAVSNARHTEISVYPTFVEAGKDVFVNSSEKIVPRFISILGSEINAVSIFENGINKIAVPNKSGIYFLLIDRANKETESYKIVVKE